MDGHYLRELQLLVTTYYKIHVHNYYCYVLAFNIGIIKLNWWSRGVGPGATFNGVCTVYVTMSMY